MEQIACPKEIAKRSGFPVHEPLIQVMHTKKQFTAKTVEDKHAEYLAIKKKSAVQYVESLEYDNHDHLLSFDISIYAGERNIFEVEINNLPKNTI